MRKILSVVLSFGLLFQQSGLVYAVGELNLANYLSHARSAIVQPDVFQPPRLRYISYDVANNDFRILLDKGNNVNQKTEKPKNEKTLESLNSSTPKLNDATQELFNYFLIGLSLPNDTFWVNLRPDAPDNIIDPLLEKTDIGKIFLDADLQLKKDTASLTSPQNPEGKIYWDKLYKKAGELFGTENITIPTITRPWIVPNEVIVRETEDSAYIYKATLKVMLESDYLIGRGGSRTAPTPDQYAFSDPRLKELNEYSTQLIRETIIPRLTKEINSSKRYAQLRQVYYSLVLARWFKQKYSGLGSTSAQGISAPANSYISLIDSGNLTSNLQPLTSQQPYSKEYYFQAYQKSFKDGEYNLKETVATPFGQSIRSYISGGLGFGFKYEAVNSPVAGLKVNSSPVTDTLTGQPPATTASPLTEKQEKINDIIGSTRELFKTFRDDFKDGFFTKLPHSIADKVKSIIDEITMERMRYPDNPILNYVRIEYPNASKFFLELSDAEFSNLFQLICKTGIEYLLNEIPSWVSLEEINNDVKGSKIGDAASKLKKAFQEETPHRADMAYVCSLIVKIWEMAAASPLTKEDRASILNEIVTKFQSELSALSAELKDAQLQLQSQLKKTQSLLSWFRSPSYMWESAKESAKLDKALTATRDSIIKIQEGKMWWDESETLREKLYTMNNIYSDILGETLYSVRASWNKAISKTEVGKQNWIRIDDTFNLKGGNMFSTARDILLESYPRYGDIYLVINKAYSAWEKHKDAATKLAGEYSAKTRASASPLAGVSSAVGSKEGIVSEMKRGGIDLTDRMLKISLERVGSFTLSSLALPEITNVEALDLDKEYERIQAMVSSSIRPSDARILEFAAACYYREEFDQRLAQVSSCIKAAHLADEISGRDSSEALRLDTMLPDALYGG